MLCVSDACHGMCESYCESYVLINTELMQCVFEIYYLKPRTKSIGRMELKMKTSMSQKK